MTDAFPFNKNKNKVWTVASLLRTENPLKNLDDHETLGFYGGQIREDINWLFLMNPTCLNQYANRVKQKLNKVTGSMLRK